MIRVEHQVFVAAFVLGATKVLGSEILGLQGGAHRPIKYEDGTLRTVEPFEEGARHGCSIDESLDRLGRTSLDFLLSVTNPPILEGYVEDALAYKYICTELLLPCMQDYFKSQKIVADYLYFYYREKRFFGQGIIDWNPETGFEVDILLHNPGLTRIEGRGIYVTESSDFCSIRIWTDNWGWALIPNIEMHSYEAGLLGKHFCIRFNIAVLGWMRYKGREDVVTLICP